MWPAGRVFETPALDPLYGSPINNPYDAINFSNKIIFFFFQVSWLKREVASRGVPVLLTFGNTVYISDARFSIQRHTDDWVNKEKLFFALTV